METPRPSFHQTAVEDLVARLERERLEADRLYNQALTALDRAIQSPRPLPPPPQPFDAARIADLNRLWNTLPDGAPVPDRSMKGRLRRFVWRLVGPALEAQVRFNAALVDHVNRNVAFHAEGARALEDALSIVRDELAALARFQSLLIQYLQTITVYVDSKDRSLGGSELRERLALTEQRLLALKRDVERVGEASHPAGPISDVSGAAEPFAGSVDALTYVAFEDRFRGSREDIRHRVEDYLPILSGMSDVVDLGCGRGELLAALRDRGMSARGVDANQAMVDLCRSRGLHAEKADALAFLQRQDDQSIGGLVAIQVVEHFSPGYLMQVLEACFHKMRPGAPLLIETINPACWMAFFETYLRDVTHRQPLHPDTLRYLVQASGFNRVDVQFRQPVVETDRLQHVVQGELADPLAALVDVVNDHANKLNARLFSFMDYVVVAWR